MTSTISEHSELANSFVQVPGKLPAYGHETAQWILDKIRLDPSEHYQGSWERLDPNSSCGTTRCIAGWAVFLHMGSLREINGVTLGSFPNENMNGYFIPAMNALKIGWEDAKNLFYDLSNEEAVHALEFLAKGERVDWDAVRDGRNTPG